MVTRLKEHLEIKDDHSIFTTNMKEYIMKHGILSGVRSVFDPLGFRTPFMLKVKQAIAGMRMEKVDWDDEVPMEMLKVWKRWLDETRYISQVKIEIILVGSTLIYNCKFSVMLLI